MVLLASRLSTYAALGILLLIECYTSTFSPVVLAEDTSCSSFAAKFALRCSLYSIGNVLLTATSYLFAARLLFGFCISPVGPSWTPSFSLLAHRRSPLIGSMAISCWQLTAQVSLFSVPTRCWTNCRTLLVVSF